jgi:aspartate aminotransferase-like enzyme
MPAPLFTPGPVSISLAVRDAGGRPPRFHRDDNYAAQLVDSSAMMGTVLGTAQEVYFTAGSGTALLESAFLNVCAPGAPVVMANNGYFGARLAAMARRAGLAVNEVEAQWHAPLSLPQIAAAVRRGADAVFVVHHETSTGYVNELAEIAGLCADTGALLVVDAISSAGPIPVEMDRLGMDVVVATSQKGIGGVPGAGVLALSVKAWDRVDALGPPRTYAGDWLRLRAAFHRTPAESLWTPPVTVMSALHAALVELVQSPSHAASMTRTARVGYAVRSGLEALGLLPLPTGAVAVAPVTVARVPPGIHATDVATRLREDFDVRVGTGQGQLGGHAVRVSHVGLTMFDVFGLLGATAAVLERLGGPMPASDACLAAAAAARDAEPVVPATRFHE